MFSNHAAVLRKYLKGVDEKGRCTVKITNQIHVLVDIVHDKLVYFVIVTEKVWTGHGMVRSGAVYGRIMYCTEHEIGSGQDKAILFWSIVCNVLPVVHCKYCATLNVLLQKCTSEIRFQLWLLLCCALPRLRSHLHVLMYSERG